ncbi:LysR substrate-binding domain-containing protein [Curvivirga aplysinae]|uniref:LysR substrate-binding domain-containing protein n=1 Tax=Curvivirga aplysinae TaxID=2529852 RepID=UPI0012BB833D|nr:LysR substrate-binding domain-containing protein [Curvivirga aplysinae]MTI09370.1 LysR family transcriptional regulator [Curvivirga aplysinae]
MKQLPPLRAIRAFEACYRLRSFTRAANSLNVQQPAVSHQIRNLEDDLQTKLFTKHGAAIVPTDEADSYYEAIAAALNDIATASERLRSNNRNDSEISLATYPGIAAYWLLPKTQLLREKYPDLIMRVTTMEKNSDILLENVDCAIVFGDGNWKGFQAVKLIDEAVIPVAAPKVAEQYQHLSGKDLLEKGPIIYLEDEEERWLGWKEWAGKLAPEYGKINKLTSTSNYGLAINQALLGHGIALGWTGVVKDFVETGALVPLNFPIMHTNNGYYLVAKEDFFNTEMSENLLNLLRDQLTTVS